MTGFESRFEISNDIVWTSPSFILTSRDMDRGETLNEYAIDNEGRIVKKVGFSLPTGAPAAPSLVARQNFRRI